MGSCQKSDAADVECGGQPSVWTVDGNTPDLGTHRLPVPVLPRVAQQQPGARAGGRGPDQRRQGQPAARAGNGGPQQGQEFDLNDSSKKKQKFYTEMKTTHKLEKS